MHAIDTNVLVRYLVGDHANQSARARKLIDNNDVFVCMTVLLEAEWVLRSVYRFDSQQIARALTSFAGLPRVTVQDARLAANALEWMLRGVDFADALHLLQSGECAEFVSFDEHFVRAAGELSSIPVRIV